jgi:hypothetical protein
VFDAKAWRRRAARYHPEVPRRYRCAACGNLTRFDVTRQRRTRAFHHYTVAGELTVEDENVLSEVVEEVVCRWCGSGETVMPVPAGSDG